MNARELRQEARECLNGKWQKAIVISLIYAAIMFVLAILVSKVPIFNIIEIIIAPALTYGLAHSYYHLKKGDEVGYVDFLTVGFKNFGRSWKITWEVIKKMWWCILIAMIPLVIMIVLMGGAIVAALGSTGMVSTKAYKSGYYYDTTSPYARSSNYNYGSNYSSRYSDEDAKLVASALESVSVGAVIGAVIAFIVYAVIMVFVAIRGLLYVLAYYIAAIKEDADPKDTVAESETLMKGNRGRYFCLMLSFFGWYFLVGLVSGIFTGFGLEVIGTILAQAGIALLAPYTAFAVLAFYKNIARERNVSIPDEEVKVVSENNEPTN